MKGFEHQFGLLGIHQEKKNFSFQNSSSLFSSVKINLLKLLNF